MMSNTRTSMGNPGTFPSSFMPTARPIGPALGAKLPLGARPGPTGDRTSALDVSAQASGLRYPKNGVILDSARPVGQFS